MRLPVLHLLGDHGRIADNEEIFSVLLLRRLGEIETSRQHHLAVDDDDLIMRNGMGGVDYRRHPFVRDKVHIPPNLVVKP